MNKREREKLQVISCQIPMPDQASKRAAEEIELRLHTLLQECHKFSQGETWPIPETIREVARREIAAIIERHCGDTERVLLRAAEWAMNDHAGETCPAYYYGECPNHDDMPFPDSCSREKKMQCFIDYWRKEAAP